VLLIDDDPLVQRIGARLFAEPDYSCAVAATAAEALEQLARFKPDVVILANALPDRAGLELLPQVNAFDSRLPVLFMTTAGSGGQTIDAIMGGAFDCLNKPLDPDLLAAQVQRALQARRLMLAPVEMSAAREPREASRALVGQSESMHEVYKGIGRVALQDMPVLIAGEPGSGKELVARSVHENGLRATGPFLTVHCRDFASPWLDSELFGHEPGALPGVATRRVGKVEQCQAGALLLKDVGDLPLPTQSKLLELLRERTFQRLGGSESLAADVAILATTSEDLGAAVAAGRFQADLYYALGTFTIAVPPLRERRDDIPLLVDHFVRRLTRIQRTFNDSVPRVSDEALALLSQYDWPGNVDELQSVLKRALLESQGTVLATGSLQRLLGRSSAGEAALDANTTAWRTLVDDELAEGVDRLYDRAIEEMERRILPLVMQRCAGSQVKAAKALGMTRGSLRKKLRRHGLLAGSPLAEESEADAAVAAE
jgi:two-component system nitrogen regulation response regulator GlnG